MDSSGLRQRKVQLNEEPTEAPKFRKLPRRKLVSALPLLWVIEIVFLVTTSIKAGAFHLLVIPFGFGLWGAGVIYAGYNYQWFHQRKIVEAFPMFWLPMPVFALTAAVAISADDYIAFLGPSAFIGMQCVRVLAIASIIKFYLGVFPFAFTWFVALPDFVFGLSAIYLYFFYPNPTPGFLVAWHIVGLAIIIPVAAIVLQTGLKPTQLYTPKVGHDILFEWPMVMGPTVVVPMLVAWNLVLARYYYLHA